MAVVITANQGTTVIVILVIETSTVVVLLWRPWLQSTASGISASVHRHIRHIRHRRIPHPYGDIALVHFSPKALPGAKKQKAWGCLLISKKK